MNRLLPAEVKDIIRDGVVRLAGLTRVPVRETVELDPLDPDRLGSIKEFFSMPKFFIIGYPRSGTTLLARLLRIHPHIHCEWQAHFLTEASSLWEVTATRELEGWARRPNNRWIRDRQHLTAMMRVIMDFTMESRAKDAGATIVGDKSPADHWSRSLTQLHGIYPDAQVVHIIRDGRDVALSRRVQQFIDRPGELDRYGQRLRKMLSSDDSLTGPKPRSIFGESWLREEARKWDREAKTLGVIGRDLYGERFADIRFEDLLGDPIGTVKMLWESLLGGRVLSQYEARILDEMEDNPAADWHAESAPRIVSGIPRGKPGGWRSVFTPEDARTYLALAGEGLRAWGYELDGA